MESKTKNEGKGAKGKGKGKNKGSGEGYFDLPATDKPFFRATDKTGNGRGEKKVKWTEKKKKQRKVRIHLRKENRCPNCYKYLISDPDKNHHFRFCIFGAKKKKGGNTDSDEQNEADAGTDGQNEADAGTDGQNETDARTDEHEDQDRHEIFRIWRRSFYHRRLNYTYFKNRFIEPNLTQNYAHLRPLLRRELESRLETDKQIKVALNTSALFGKQLEGIDGEEDIHLHRIEYLFTGYVEINHISQIDDLLDFFFSFTERTITSYLDSGSNFIVLNIIQYRLEIVKIPGIAARGYQKLPSFITPKHVIQLHNLKRECILICVALQMSLQMRYRGFPKTYWSQLLPPTIDDDQIFSLCGPIYQDLYTKTQHLFPLKSGKNNFEQFKKALGLKDYYLNVLWATENDLITNYADVGKQDFKGETEDDQIHDFEHHCIDILIFHEKPLNFTKNLIFGHCALITDLSGLVNQIKDNRNRHRHFYCRLCNSHFRTKEIFIHHITKQCLKINPNFQKMKMPEKNSTNPNLPSEPELKLHEKKGLVYSNYLACVDLELSFTTSENAEQRLQNGDILSEECYGAIASACIMPTMQTSCYDTDEIRSYKTHFFEPIITDGESSVYDCLVGLVQQSQLAKTHLDAIYHHYEKIRLTDEERKIADETDRCENFLCGKKFEKKQDKCMDHCKVGSESKIPGRGGGLRRTVCSDCNLTYFNLQQKRDFQIYAHAGSHLDFALLIKAVSKAISSGDLRFRAVKMMCKSSSERYLMWSFSYSCSNCIPSTKPNQSCQHSFSRYIFKDSYCIMPNSLSQLVAVSAQGVLDKTQGFEDAFPLYARYLKKHKYMSYLSDTDLLCKNSMPFLMLSADKRGEEFLKSTEFITKEQWKENRFGDEIDLSSYEKCYHFWQSLQKYEQTEKQRALTWCEMFRYYCLSDTMFLICILDKYISDSFKETGRNLSQLLTLSSYSQRVFFDTAKRENTPVLSHYNKNMFNFFESCITGGCVSLNHTRINKANCSFLPEYDPTKPDQFLMLLDMNSQFSNSMSEFSHPYSDFRFNTRAEMNQTFEDICNGSWRLWREDCMYKQKDRFGQIQDYMAFFVVDLDLDKKHHDRLKCFPMTMVKRCPRREWLSKTSRKSLNYMRFGTFTDDPNLSDDYSNDETIDFNEDLTSSYDISQVKLLPVLSNVRNYPVNHRYLALLLQMGYKLKAIKQMVTCIGKKIFTTYIRKIIQQRSQTNDQVTKERKKNESNAIWGKVHVY